MDDQATLQKTLSFTLNGQPVRLDAPFGERLSESLRERCGARDVRSGATLAIAAHARCCLTARQFARA